MDDALPRQVAFEPPRRFAYRLLSGIPVKDHVGTIELEPAGEGTRMSYVLETTPKVPVVRSALIPVIRNVVDGIAAGIAAEAEKRAAS